MKAILKNINLKIVIPCKVYIALAAHIQNSDMRNTINTLLTGTRGMKFMKQKPKTCLARGLGAATERK